MSINKDETETEYEYQKPPLSLFSIPQFISVESTNDKLRQTIIELKEIIKNLKIFKECGKITVPIDKFTKHMIVLQQTVDELKNTIENSDSS